MNKKQIGKKIKLMLLSCLILVSFMAEEVNLVYADSTTSIDVLFEQKFIDTSGSTVTTADTEFIYELIAQQTGNPMPMGSVGDVFESTLRGNAGGVMNIKFNEPGVFEYTLKASDRNDLRGLIPASEMSYRIEITILKKMDGELDPFIFAFNADGEKVVDPPFVYTMKNPHDVKYGFQSGTPGMDLPQAVKDLLPATETGKFDGDVVSPSAYPPVGTTVKANGGTWTFVGWDYGEQTIDDDDVFFVGKWIFTADPSPSVTAQPTKSPPTKPHQPDKGGNLKTGDTTKIYTLIALAVASMGVIFLAIAKRRKRDDEA